MKSNMFRRFALMTLALMALSAQAQKTYSYESFPGDPLKARIYTLDNGLKVYLTENKEKPRIQTYIAVRVGGKNDPAETTGLAHYFEHLMFKGTKKFGTQNYAAEEPLLNAIEQTFEVYRHTTDSLQRKAIYHKIDSLSYEASKIAIPNEYDKLMAAIGADGTNAYTSYDVTCYTEDIPSNQMENWAKIQSDRFQNATIRGFHTELEAVYEEKNMSLTQDNRKIFDKMWSMLCPHHPYGTQTILGTQEQLKNPSITNIKKYFDTWYVANNIAICMSGDLDFDKTIALIDAYFGKMRTNPNLPRLQFAAEPEQTAPSTADVYGLEAEMLLMAWRFPGAGSLDMDYVEILSDVLSNSKAGLLDLDLNQKQKLLAAQAFFYDMSDYSALCLLGYPGQGQTLDDVRNLLIAEVDKLRKGDFDEALLEAIINNYKRSRLRLLESNEGRANMFVQSFVNGSNWKDEVEKLDRMSKITKEGLVAFANKFMKDNYAVIYKRQGADTTVVKMNKPEITPLETNRDKSSQFLANIQEAAKNATPIEPVFVDFNKDMQKAKTQKGLELLYKKNDSNDLFSLNYYFDFGTHNDKVLGYLGDYWSYLNTPTMTAEQLNTELYRLACDISFSFGGENSSITLSGLSENMPKAISLLEDFLANAQVNKEAYAKLVDDMLKAREMSKANQSSNFSALLSYATYGQDSPQKNILSEGELKALNPQVLVDKLHQLTSYKHRVLYYGPMELKALTAAIDKEHVTPAKWLANPVGKKFVAKLTTESRILLAPYDAKQVYFNMFSNKGEKYDVRNAPVISLYNEYFGGGMNTIVFQEMREARGLAYSAWASMFTPNKLDKPYTFEAFIATQNDKLLDAYHAFDEIINNMPAVEAAFKIAKEAWISRMATNRTTKSAVLNYYITMQRLGLDYDVNKRIYEAMKTVTLEDVKKYQQEHIKGRAYSISILGDEKDLDMESLGKIAPITKLTTEDIFGY